MSNISVLIIWVLYWCLSLNQTSFSSSKKSKCTMSMSCFPLYLPGTQTDWNRVVNPRTSRHFDLINRVDCPCSSMSRCLSLIQSDNAIVIIGYCRNLRPNIIARCGLLNSNRYIGRGHIVCRFQVSPAPQFEWHHCIQSPICSEYAKVMVLFIYYSVTGLDFSVNILEKCRPRFSCVP